MSVSVHRYSDGLPWICGRSYAEAEAAMVATIEHAFLLGLARAQTASIPGYRDALAVELAKAVEAIDRVKAYGYILWPKLPLIQQMGDDEARDALRAYVWDLDTMVSRYGRG